MKRIISAILLLTLCLTLFGCGDNGSDATQATHGQPKVLEVGFGKACISPTEPVVMNGGWMTGFLDDVYAITVAFRDEENNIYIHVVTDLSWGGMSDENVQVSYGVCDMVRDAAERELGLSPEYITVGGTHNHSQVNYSSKEEANERWRNNVLIPQVLASIKQAMEDLSPAEMHIGTTQTKNLTFVRRYWLEDGSLYEGYTGNKDSQIKEHETAADEQIQMVNFVREGKKDVLMVNWQTHATKVSSSGTQVCPDFVGPLRDRVEEALDVLCVFYQGACGNLAPTSRIPGEAAIEDSGWAGAQKIGWAVAAYVIDAFESEVFVKVNTGLIQMERITVTGDVYKFDEDLYEAALRVQEFHKTSKHNYDTAAYAAQFGIETIYHANAIVQNYKLGDKKTYELNIISIGDVAFTTLPMEFFDTTGMQIKNGSPFDMTILLGYSCGKGKYVPDVEAYGHGGYESYNTYFVPGTAEIAVEHYLNSLNKLFTTRY